MHRLTAALMANKAKAVSFDGEIGAGKTTIIKHVKKALAARGIKAAVVREPVEDWERVGILRKFYEVMREGADPELRSSVTYNFQTYTFVTRLRETQRVVAECPDADVYLLERNVLTDRFVFMELQREAVGPVLMEMYDEWWSLWAQLMPIEPGLIVYLKPSLDNCQARVAVRGREGEVVCAKTDGGVSAEYQKRLRRAHEAYLQGLHASEFPDMPPRPFAPEDVVVVDGPLADHDFSAPGPAADQTAAHIVDNIVKKLLGGA